MNHRSGQAYVLSLLGSPCRVGNWRDPNVNLKSSPGREEGNGGDKWQVAGGNV